jgi:ubiquinone/menaquinone biosynthesis C-methylase UbiE
MGKEHEQIPNAAFSIMTFAMKVIDLLSNYSNKNFKNLGLKEGQIVVDYGCGPARYIANASKAVGSKGRVYAVDIHPKAIEAVNSKIAKYNLTNVEPLLANDYNSRVPDNSADVVYALDMFHMISDPLPFLVELARMVKPRGCVIIEDGHQARSETKRKIEKAKLFFLERENKHHVVCKRQVG